MVRRLDNQKKTPLHVAVESGSCNAAKLLIANGNYTQGMSSLQPVENAFNICQVCQSHKGDYVYWSYITHLSISCVDKHLSISCVDKHTDVNREINIGCELWL